MAKPTEYKTVRSRILAYAKEIGWIFVPCEEPAGRKGLIFDFRSFVRIETQ